MARLPTATAPLERSGPPDLKPQPKQVACRTAPLTLCYYEITTYGAFIRNEHKNPSFLYLHSLSYYVHTLYVTVRYAASLSADALALLTRPVRPYDPLRNAASMSASILLFTVRRSRSKRRAAS